MFFFYFKNSIGGCYSLPIIKSTQYLIIKPSPNQCGYKNKTFLFALMPQIVATLVSDVSANVYFSFKNCWKLINSRVLVLELCETEKWISRKINRNHFLRFSYFHFIRHEDYNNRLRHLSFAFQHVHFGLLFAYIAVLGCAVLSSGRVEGHFGWKESSEQNWCLLLWKLVTLTFNPRYS